MACSDKKVGFTPVFSYGMINIPHCHPLIINIYFIAIIVLSDMKLAALYFMLADLVFPS